MDYELNVTENPDGTAYIWCQALGVMQVCACWNDAEAIFDLLGVGAP
jgi:hypothetical protein